MVCTAFSGSAIASAFVAAAPPIIMCAIVYTGGKFLVNLIKNYQEDQHKTPEMKAVEKAAERYAWDFQYALDRTLHISTVNAIPKNPLYYSMCYGYQDDLHAKVITIVDKQHKQHIFVVPDASSKSVFQISDGSKQSEPFISFRYLAPQATIDAIEQKRKGSNKEPEDDDDEIPRIYVGVDYHGTKATAIKSAGPKNGQAAFDKSYPIGPRTRVGVSNKQIVVLGRTLMRPQGGSEWHGYVTTWDDLKQNQKHITQNILIEQGLVNARGKIL